MRRIDELAGKPLEWVQPSTFRKQFDLRAGDEVVATLKFGGIFDSLATGESIDGSWTIHRSGFWRPRTTVRPTGSDTDIATFMGGTWKSGGTLILADGRELSVTTSVMKSTLVLADPEQGELIKFTSRGVVHLAAGVEIRPAAAQMPELPWLVMLGWYICIKIREDVAAAAGAAGAAS